MNVEIGAEAAIFPGKEYISGIFLAVQGLYSFNSNHVIKITSVFIAPPPPPQVARLYIDPYSSFPLSLS